MWLLRVLGWRIAVAVWRAARRRGLWTVILAALPIYGSTDDARDRAPGFADAVATTLAMFLWAAVLAVALAVALMVFVRWWRDKPTLYERINATALGITVPELRELWDAERADALRKGAEPWADDRIRQWGQG